MIIWAPLMWWLIGLLIAWLNVVAWNKFIPYFDETFRPEVDRINLTRGAWFVIGLFGPFVLAFPIFLLFTFGLIWVSEAYDNNFVKLKAWLREDAFR